MGKLISVMPKEEAVRKSSIIRHSISTEKINKELYKINKLIEEQCGIGALGAYYPYSCSSLNNPELNKIIDILKNAGYTVLDKDNRTVFSSETSSIIGQSQYLQIKWG